MKKIGLIPPHFLFFLENEGIKITDFKSSNFTAKENYDRIIVKFPYGLTTLDIQVIFDVVDLSSPPDFVLLTESDFFIDYNEIVKNWNFRESNSLYNSLRKIKQLYSDEQLLKLKQTIFEKKKQGDKSFENIEGILNNILKSLSNYKELPKSSHFIDVLLTYNRSAITQVDISYPLDCVIKSREINRAPIFIISVPVGYNNNFSLDMSLPYFLSRSTINFTKDVYSIGDYKCIIETSEKRVISDFKAMQIREFVLLKIIESNIGFPIEFDTRSYTKLTLYFHAPRDENVVKQSLQQMANTINTNNLNDFNYLLIFCFLKEDTSKFEFSIVDCDRLKLFSRKRLEFGSTQREVNQILHTVMTTLVELLNRVKKKN